MCGIFGLIYPNKNFYNYIVESTLSGLIALQHRGEESAGIVVGDGQSLSPSFRRMGLVRNLYKSYQESEENIKDNLTGYLSIAHTRYSTTGSSNLHNAAPFVFNTKFGKIAVTHNGNITNSELLRKNLEKKGYRFSSTTDSEIIGGLLSLSSSRIFIEALKLTLNQLEGSFSLIIATKNSLIAVRDPHGNRPIAYAEFHKDKITGYAISSESSAFDHLSINYRRELKPGELIIFDKRGFKCLNYSRYRRQHLCSLEIAYLMRPDSRLNNIQLDTIRRQLGKKLAEYHPCPRTTDFITYIPESAKSSAEGYAEAISALYRKPIISKTSILKNRYGNINGAIRGFINPNQSVRDNVASSNYHPFDILNGKEIALVDDSIIRGTTTRSLIQILKKNLGNLKNSGVKKIHLRIIFPPVINYCPLGTDINIQDTLIAKQYGQIDKIAKAIGVDSLAYLSCEEYQNSVNEIFKKNFGLCLGCANNNYPVNNIAKDNVKANKQIFEK